MTLLGEGQRRRGAAQPPAQLEGVPRDGRDGVPRQHRRLGARWGMVFPGGCELQKIKQEKVGGIHGADCRKKTLFHTADSKPRCKKEYFKMSR